MQPQPRRALLDEPEVIETARPRRGSRRRVGLVTSAVLAVTGLVAAAIIPSLTQAPVPAAEPAAVASPQAERSEPVSRSNLRQEAPTQTPTQAPETQAPSPAAAAEKVSADASASPKSLPALGKSVGKRWATAGLNLRTGPGTEYDVVRTIAEGSSVAITDVVVEGWQQVDVKGKAAYVSAKYLTDKEPKEFKKPRERDSNADPGAPGSCNNASAKRAASGLTARTKGVLWAVCEQFPNVKSYGGRRSGGNSHHASGRAIDVMISGDAGWEVAKWARKNAKALGITEVLYAQKIWTVQRSGDGWRSMPDRGTDSANHYDHVHLSVR